MKPFTMKRDKNEALSRFSYLAIVPRGLQREISASLRERAGSEGQNQNHDSEALPERKKSENDNDAVLKVTIWNEEEDNETMREALRDFSRQREEKAKRHRERERERQDAPPAHQGGSNRGNKERKTPAPHQRTKAQLEEHISSAWLPTGCSVGSVKLSSSGQHVSIGYCSVPDARGAADIDSCAGVGVGKTAGPPPCIPTWTCTGQMAGSVWMQLETNQERISRTVVAPSRSLGPLLALVSVQTDNSCLQSVGEAPPPSANESSRNDGEQLQQQRQPTGGPGSCYQRYYQHSLQEMVAETTRHIRLDPSLFSERLDRAFRVWKDCIETTWRNRLSPSDFEGLQQRIRENRLRFRMSCMRVEPSLLPSSFSRKRKKKFQALSEQLFVYSRKELCRGIMDACGSDLVPNYHQQNPKNDNDNDAREKEEIGGWTVDLDKFDIELVLLIIPPGLRSTTGKLAIGISLCPYSFLRSKSFEAGQIPPDVTVPYLGGDILSQGIVRLRPTTAHLLLQMANPRSCDVVLDPCAGIGTIPVEAECYQACLQPTRNSRSGRSQDPCCLAIGGDLVLNNPKYTRIAGINENISRGAIINTTSSLLVAWDAAHLPMRTSSADIAVSDLPFGQQCLSVNSLNQLLPLVFLECARVLRTSTGRMVMLAGGSPIALIANIEKLSGKYWKSPIRRVSPVSIGGILAWTIVVMRNEEPFDRDIVPEQRSLIKKIAQKRDRISRQRNSESGEQQTGKRRRHANEAQP